MAYEAPIPIVPFGQPVYEELDNRVTSQPEYYVVTEPAREDPSAKEGGEILRRPRLKVIACTLLILLLAAITAIAFLLIYQVKGM